MTDPLFKPLTLGSLQVPNRVLMAPLTRNRAERNGTAREMAIDYYSQRASAGLIISEATQSRRRGRVTRIRPASTATRK